MTGTLDGGRQARDTNLGLYGEDYYARIGALGGAARVPKGFAMMPREKVVAAGLKGGRNSKRGKNVNKA